MRKLVDGGRGGNAEWPQMAVIDNAAVGDVVHRYGGLKLRGRDALGARDAEESRAWKSGKSRKSGVFRYSAPFFVISHRFN